MDQQSSEEPEKVKTEDDLLELAKKELLRDTKCASIRAEQFGAHSWAKPQKYIPSKRFLKHMLSSASRENDRTHNQWKANRKAKITSAVIHPSDKPDHSSKRERQSEHKHSRWETDDSPKHKKSSSDSPKHKKSSSDSRSKSLDQPLKSLDQKKSRSTSPKYKKSSPNSLKHKKSSSTSPKHKKSSLDSLKHKKSSSQISKHKKSSSSHKNKKEKRHRHHHRPAKTKKRTK